MIDELCGPWLKQQKASPTDRSGAANAAQIFLIIASTPPVKREIPDILESTKGSLPNPGPEETLSSACGLMDEELYASTVERIQLKTIVQNLRDGVRILNLAGVVTDANQALCAMRGQDENLLKGKPLTHALGEMAEASTPSTFNAVLSGTEGAEHESELHHPFGTKTPVIVSVVPLRDFLGAPSVATPFHDITRR